MEKIKEGDLYKIIELFDRSFEIKYGYYVEYEKGKGEPIPIYPDFKKHPIYTNEGQPFVTQMQEICSLGKSRFSDGCCVDCEHYRHGTDLIGICTNKGNEKQNFEKDS